MKPLLLLGLGVFVFLKSLLGAEPSRPNIIFILTDDQRYDELGCTGHGRGYTRKIPSAS